MRKDACFAPLLVWFILVAHTCSQFIPRRHRPHSTTRRSAAGFARWLYAARHDVDSGRPPAFDRDHVTAILQSCRLQVSRATGKDFVMGTSGSCIREVHLRLPNAEVIVPCGAIRLCTIQHLRAIVVDVADEPVGWCHADAVRLVRAQ